MYSATESLQSDFGMRISDVPSPPGNRAVAKGGASGLHTDRMPKSHRIAASPPERRRPLLPHDFPEVEANIGYAHPESLCTLSVAGTCAHSKRRIVPTVGRLLLDLPGSCACGAGSPSVRTTRHIRELDLIRDHIADSVAAIAEETRRLPAERGYRQSGPAGNSLA